MEKNLYRDDINQNEDFMGIERDLAQFEGEIAPIVEKIRDEREPILTLEEDEKLRLFFAIMGFRAKRVAEFFQKKGEEMEKDIFSFFQGNGDMADFWKRNLGLLVKCRRRAEVLGNPEIDGPVKAFMLRDAYGIPEIGDMYFVILERRRAEDFVIGDCYPLVTNGEPMKGWEIPLYSCYPISAKRMLMLVSNIVEKVPPEIIDIESGIFKRPCFADGKLKFSVQKVYGEDVECLNELIFKNSTEGVVVQSEAMVKTLMERQRSKEVQN